ncbi:MAG: ECF transporter S component [Fervidicoccaceae archaeon]
MTKLAPRDWALIAGFSVLSGVIFAITSLVIAPPLYVFGHVGIAVIYGLWFVGGTLVGYVVRKPWSAFLGETLGAIVELLMLSPYSIMLYYYGPAQGIMTEIVFRLRGYKNFDYKTMALAGAMPTIAAYPFDCFVSPFYPACREPGYPPELHVALIALYLVSGALLAGVLVKFLVDSAVKMGAFARRPSAER